MDEREILLGGAIGKEMLKVYKQIVKEKSHVC